MIENSEYVIELLLHYGMITQEQVDQGWEKVASSEGTLDIIDALIFLKYINETDMMAMLAQEYGLETFDLTGFKVDEELLAAVPPHIAKQYQIFPVSKTDDMLTIAMSDPTDMETLDTLRYVIAGEVDAVISPLSQIQSLVDQNYGTQTESVDSFMSHLSEDEIDEIGMEKKDSGAITDDDDDSPIIRLVSLILVEAHKMGASDIHLEPMEKRYRVRYRIDGVLQEIDAPPKYLQAQLTSRLKIMSRLDISEKRVPQDGRIQLKLEGAEIDLRVSTVPTTHGESIVMRILDKSSIQLDIPALGFYNDDLEKINKIINLPDGIFLVTGPTGSGKTTSLYAFLNTINTPSRKIITVEDPIEYQLSGINQVQADHATGLTFAIALRAMLRQAPNIIMVGEIRDLSTAEIAINAALTGHLVFSTLHTNDAPSAVTRLVDMGMKSFLISTAVRAVMAQRLCRRICSECSTDYTPTERELAILAMDPEEASQVSWKMGAGCKRCNGTGYKGRVGIYEIFMMTEETRDAIFDEKPVAEIRDGARRGGMRTLQEDALRKAAAGTTTLEEVIRVTMTDEEE